MDQHRRLHLNLTISEKKTSQLNPETNEEAFTFINHNEGDEHVFNRDGHDHDHNATTLEHTSMTKHNHKSLVPDLNCHAGESLQTLHRNVNESIVCHTPPDDPISTDPNPHATESPTLEQQIIPNDLKRDKLDEVVESPISRLSKSQEEGIRSRIELLGELLVSDKLDPVPDSYDETDRIIKAIERNERLQAGEHGQRLSQLANAAKSNRNVDLGKLDKEIQLQFGLYAVEVTGDGACAFRAILISGLQSPDCLHSDVREKAIQQVLNDKPYYSTVIRPGDKVSDQELFDWVETMRDPYTYGDELANIAVADHFHLQLVIFRAGELLTVINPRDGYVKHIAFLVNVGTHYKALVPFSELPQAIQNSERLNH